MYFFINIFFFRFCSAQTQERDQFSLLSIMGPNFDIDIARFAYVANVSNVIEESSLREALLSLSEVCRPALNFPPFWPPLFVAAELLLTSSLYPVEAAL